jgi:NADH-quinone oxidoreductase subunit H
MAGALFGGSPVLALGDPLFGNGVDWAVFLIVIIKVVVAFAALMGTVTIMIWFERKVISDMQARIGPNRAGPWGLLQTLADGTKLIFKEDFVPEKADRTVYKLAPYLALMPAFLAFAIVPIGGFVTVAGHSFELQVADPPVGILFLLAMSSVSVYGVMLAGWSSGSKYPLLGSVRASAQMISYEAAMGLAVVTVVLIAGTLSTRGIIAAQATTFFASWNVIRTALIPFVIFMIAITAELQRPPFDLAEADSELVGGFNTEYASFHFAVFYMAEFMNVITMSAVAVTLFLGGPDGPTAHVYILSWVIPILWFLGKTSLFLFLYVWLRAALPRLRYDQLMDLGWKVLIPLSLGWVLLVAAGTSGHWWPYGIFLAIAVCFGLLVRAVVVGRQRNSDTGAVAGVVRGTGSAGGTLSSVPTGRGGGPTGRGTDETPGTVGP